ncbi:MAG: tetratricopeptide repeat protein [Acidobacteria bacterium]|nr:tetratricopeptide repeat protein [Acidobacteriota bacterium]
MDRIRTLLRALTDPHRSQALQEAFSEDAEALERVTWALMVVAGSDPEFTLRTGGGLVGPVWDRIFEVVEGRPLDPGQELGRYAVLDHVGSGGMGSVYSAYDSQLDRRVAVKLLHATGADDQDRLLREARALAQLAHPNVVGVHDVGTHEGRVFVAMEFVDGTPLRAWSEGRTTDEIVAVYIEAGRGLAAAHRAGLVHRDFKPDNVIVDADGVPQVVDFGLARATEEGAGDAHISGTPGYIAPEQVLHRRFGPRSDQFAFAASVWEAIYGHKPFSGNDLASMAQTYEAGQPPVAPDQPPLAGGLARALERSLSIDPGERFESMDALLDELVDEPATTTTNLWIAAAAGGALLVAGWLWLQPAAALCADSVSQLIGIWDADRAGELRATFANAGLEPEEFARVEGALDRYADGWATMRGDSCAATNIRGEQSPALLDLRTTCLNRRRGELQAVVNTLAGGDPAALARAADTVLGLEPLAVCADTALLTAAVARPQEPGRLAELESLETRLGEVRVVGDSAGPGEALPLAEELAVSADAFDYAPLAAEAWHLVGDLQDYLGEFDAAEASLFAAWTAAEEGHHEEYVIRALNLLVWLDGNDRGNAEAADRWAALAEAAIAAADAGPYVRAEYYNNRGAGLQQSGRLEEAFAAHNEALRLRTEVYGADHVEIGKSLSNLGTTQYSAGRYQEAQDLFRRAATILRRELGPHHQTAMAISNIGAAYIEMLDGESALPYHEEALEMRQQVFGPDGFMVAQSVVNLGFANVLVDPEQAILDFAEADRIFALYVPEDHFYRIFSVSGTGRALFEAGRYEDAVPYLRRSSAAWQASDNALAQDVSGDLFLLAKALVASDGSRSEAFGFARQAREVAAAVEGAELEIVADIDAWLADNE